MPKGKPNNRYTGEFKQMVVEAVINERLSYTEGSLFIQIETRNALEKEQDHHQGNMKDASVPNKLVHSVSLSWFI